MLGLSDGGVAGQGHCTRCDRARQLRPTPRAREACTHHLKKSSRPRASTRLPRPGEPSQQKKRKERTKREREKEREGTSTLLRAGSRVHGRIGPARDACLILLRGPHPWVRIRPDGRRGGVAASDGSPDTGKPECTPLLAALLLVDCRRGIYPQLTSVLRTHSRRSEQTTMH